MEQKENITSNITEDPPSPHEIILSGDENVGKEIPRLRFVTGVRPRGRIAKRKRLTHKKRSSYRASHPKVSANSTNQAKVNHGAVSIVNFVGTTTYQSSSVRDASSVLAGNNGYTLNQVPGTTTPYSYQRKMPSKGCHKNIHENSSQLITSQQDEESNNGDQWEHFMKIEPPLVDITSEDTHGEFQREVPCSVGYAEEDIGSVADQTTVSDVHLALSSNFHNYASPVTSNCSGPSTLSTTLRRRQLPARETPGTLDFLKEVRSKLEPFLKPRWHVCVKPNAIHVVLMSAEDNMTVQRNLVCFPHGKVELYVHCQLIRVDRFVSDLPPFVALTRRTLNQYIHRIVAILDQVRNLDVCSGWNKEKFKSYWKSCSQGNIDRNPYKEIRYKETLRSKGCLRLVRKNSWRCLECAKLQTILQKQAESADPNTPNVYLADKETLKKLQDQASILNNAIKEISRLGKGNLSVMTLPIIYRNSENDSSET